MLFRSPTLGRVFSSLWPILSPSPTQVSDIFELALSELRSLEMNRSRFSVVCLEQSFPEGIVKPSDG